MRGIPLETLEVSIVCNSAQSVEVPTILNEIAKEQKGVNYKIADTYSFGPIFDETTVKIIFESFKLSTPIIIAILTALLEKTSKKNMRTEYKDRFKLAVKTLEDKAPLDCEEMTDSPSYSKYVFVTIRGKYVWIYNKGKISLEKGKDGD
jgi:hypothetical protein